MRIPLRAFALAIPLALSSGCGTGGGGGTGGGAVLPPPEVGLFASDAPADDLLALVGSITTLVLFKAGGGDTGNLLPAAIPLNLAALDGRSAPLAFSTPEAGTYTSAFAAFAPGTVTSRTESGFVLPVAMPIASGTASFPSPLVIQNGDHLALQLDFDLTRSVVSDGAGGLAFIPLFRARVLPAGSSIVGLDGIVTDENPGARTFTADLVPQGAAGPALGSVEVEVEAVDLLAGADGVPFVSVGAFFTALAVGSRVAVRGDWQEAGFIDATSVKIEPLDPLGLPVQVEILGRVGSIDSFNSVFALQIASVESGTAAVGGAPFLVVSYGAGTDFTFEDPPGPATAGLLRIGHAVRVRFAAFGGPPFPAAAVEIERPEVDFEGTITDTSGLPGSIVATLDPDDPHVVLGIVSGPVSVSLAGSGAPTLHLPGSPALLFGDLRVPQAVRIRGSLSTSILATGVEVLPGRVRTSTVTGVTPAASQFACTFDTLAEPDDPFGGTTTSPATVIVEPGALLLGTSGEPITMIQFNSSFLNPPPGQSLRAEFQGIGTSTAGTVRAFDVRLRFQ